MTLQKRLKRIMRRKECRISDLARHFGVPYTTAREWVVNGRLPSIDIRPAIDRVLESLEKSS